LDLGRVELHAFDFGGELLAQGFVFLLARGRVILPAAENVDAFGLDLLELLEQLRDAGEPLERLGLERGFHLREAEGVVFLFLFLAAAGAGIAVLVLVVGGFLLFLLGLFLFLVGRPGGLLADLTAVVVVLLFH